MGWLERLIEEYRKVFETSAEEDEFTQIRMSTLDRLIAIAEDHKVGCRAYYGCPCCENWKPE